MRWPDTYAWRVSRSIPAASQANGRELLLAASLAGLVSLLLVAVVPQGGDLAAHLYRTLLVRHAVLVWDNLWFAGQYPLFSYSLLYYLAASVVGNAVLGVASLVLAAVLFASVTMREWGSAARWPARSFAVLATGQSRSRLASARSRSSSSCLL